MFCKNCGREIPEQSTRCLYCGTPVSDKSANAMQEVNFSSTKIKTRKTCSHIVAGLLGIFLGSFGIHKFYLGSPFGIFYFIFCWTFIPTIIGIVEGIIYLCTAQNVFEKKYMYTRKAKR